MMHAQMMAWTLGTVAIPSGTSPGTIASGAEEAIGLTGDLWETYGPVLLGYGVKIAGVIILLIIASIIAGTVSSIVFRALSKSSVDMTLAKFLSKSARWTILLLSLIACLGVFGVETTSFAAVIGAAGLAIGLAFQGSLSNLAAGVMLLLFRPFSVGQVVTVAGTTGTIDEIGLFTTSMDTPDNRRFIIPNGAIFGSVIENISHHTVRRVNVEVGTGYGDDLDETREVLGKAIASVGGQVEGKDPQVVLGALGGSSIEWGVRIWVPASEFWSKKEELTRAIKIELDKAGIDIPFPQQVVTIIKGNDA